jgi:septum formation protein
MKLRNLLLSFAAPLEQSSFIPYRLQYSEVRRRGAFTTFAMATTTDDNDGGTSATIVTARHLVSLRERLVGNGIQNDSPLGRLVLASQSPRRREILDMMGLVDRYSVEPSPLDESQLQKELVQQNLPCKDYTQRLAEAKAHALAEAHCATEGRNLSSAAIFYLGSDTIVELDENILEKPRDAKDAKRMLKMMSGRQHHVHTGVALYRLYQNEVSLVGSFTDTATVTFADLGEDDIDAYTASGEPMDKAGSYGIQGMGGQFVTGIIGDFFTVMGMPMHKTSQLVTMALQDEACRKAPK